MTATNGLAEVVAAVERLCERTKYPIWDIVPGDFVVTVGLQDLELVLAKLESLLGGCDAPEGWKLVPLRMTDDMIESAYYGDRNHMRFSEDELRTIYCNVIAASPPPPESKT